MLRTTLVSSLACAGTLFVQSAVAATATTQAAALASMYSLTTSTSMPFPSATESSSDAQDLLVSQWSLSKGRIQNGADDLAFTDDPFPSSQLPDSTSTSSSPVLAVTYPQGSFSHDTGGTQFYSLWNTSVPSYSMLLSYEVAFDSGFDWVKGGKLPGIRGGPDPNGCSGGTQPNGTDCFSSRVMWRPNGAGEVYAYFLNPSSVCNRKTATCNSDFGVSFNRGDFTFPSGQWSRITMFVQMNNPPNVANGQILLYFNDAQVSSQQGIQFRSGGDISAGGLYFSTFFGGSDESWATPQTTHSYFRNVQMWASSQPSNLTGSANGALQSVPWRWSVGGLGTAMAALVAFLV